MVRNEAKLIKKIAEDVLIIVEQKHLHVAAYPTGLEFHIERISCLLNDGLNLVSIIGIYGSGGIGKTTIAKAIFNQVLKNFEGGSFLANVREVSSQQKGLVPLQKQLLYEVLKRKVKGIYNEDNGITAIEKHLHGKKVLIVLDDVEETEQFCKLVGGYGQFGPGSRIILTTRDERLLNALDVDQKYIVNTMNQKESLQLFSCHAFRQQHPLKDYVQLSKNVIDYAGGLPLALVILGSLLYKRSKAEWERELKKLRTIPNSQILEKLEISYNALDHMDRIIFLDISCLFIGVDKDFVIKILDACGMGGEAGIKLLIERSLVTIDIENKLHMHDLIRDMGREIIRKQSPEKSGGRSRLWSKDDGIDVLINLTGTDVVECLQLNLFECNMEELRLLTTEGFTKMPNLRLVTIQDSRSRFSIDQKHSLEKQVFCFRNLVWLDWKGFPFKYMPNNFHLGKLVILYMQNSKLNKLWKGTKYLTKLKYLHLNDSPNLTHTPDVSGLPNLEEFILNNCGSLVDVHKSIYHLKKLVRLSLKDCKRLKSLPLLPSSLCYLDASGCSILERLNLSNLKHLMRLFLLNCIKLTKIEGLEDLVSATTIRLDGCVQLSSFVKNGIFQGIGKSVGNSDVVCDFFLDGNEIPEWFGFQRESEALLSWQDTQLHNMMQGLIICFTYFNDGPEYHEKQEDPRILIHNESKNLTWSHESEFPISGCEELTTWGIRIPSCVWKSIAESWDIIDVAMETKVWAKHIEVKKIGVHCFYA